MPRESNDAAIARSLTTPPVAIDRLHNHRALLPSKAGFYAWWAREGAVTSWRHCTYKNRPRERACLLARPLGGRHPRREAQARPAHSLRQPLEEPLAKDDDEKRAGNLRRERRAETIVAIIASGRLRAAMSSSAT